MTNNMDNSIDRVKSLMNFTAITESNNRCFTSEIIQYQKQGADNKCYAVVKEGKNHYIKVSEKTENPLREDFDYIGGIGNKSRYAYDGYHKAVRNLELKLRQINEAIGNGATFDAFNPDAKADYIIEDTSKMSKELKRQKEIMRNVAGIMNEGNLTIKPVMDAQGKATSQTEPYTEKSTPKPDATPSKGTNKPTDKTEPFTDASKPDMKADPSKAGKTFKITGTQFAQLKAKLVENEGRNDRFATDTIKYNNANPIDHSAGGYKPYQAGQGVPSEIEESDSPVNSDNVGYAYPNMIIKLADELGDKKLSQMVRGVDPSINDYDKYIVTDHIIDYLSDMLVANGPNQMVDNLRERMWNIQFDNPAFMDATKGEDEDVVDDVDLDSLDVDVDNIGFEDDVDTIDLTDTNIFDEEIEEGRNDRFANDTSKYNNANPLKQNNGYKPYQAGQGSPFNEENGFDMSEEELIEMVTEEVLNVFGKHPKYGNEPFTLPDGGTQKKQYGTSKGNSAPFTKPVSPAEAAPDTEVPNPELKPKDSVVDKDKYVKDLTESIIKGLKKKQ